MPTRLSGPRDLLAAGAQLVGGRFDRGLRRVAAERTSLLSWLAESDQAEGLRADGEIDLRDDSVIDVRPAPVTASGQSVDTGGPESTDELASSSLPER